MASHELRTPLTAIEGFTTTMLDRWDQLEDADKRMFLEIVDSQSRRLTRLVEDLLTLSRVESGNVKVKPRTFGLAKEIEAALREIRSSDVEVEVPDALTAYADPEHVTQILINYLTNARKYGEPPIKLVAQPHDGFVDIAVIDSGEGVPSNFAPKLFNPFARADRTEHDVPGTGLGLSIVRGLAEAQGGSAWYEPHEPHGSCFVVRLPRSPVER
jgi:signal transduction histidine kinase